MQKSEIICLLDNVRSKFNVGSILRSAEALGVNKVILTGVTAYPPDAHISKTALGAEQVVPWQYYQNSREAICDLKDQGIKIVVAETSSNAVLLPDFKAPNTSICIVMGNEITGVSPQVMDEADVIVKIPMLGQVKESFNVEVSFAIIASWIRFHS